MVGSATRWFQRLFFVAGFVILGYCGADWLNSRWRQAEGDRQLDRILSYRHSDSYRSGDKSAIPTPENTRLADGALIGKVEIPRLRLSAVVFQGTDSSVLNH